jgi:serine/threonine-protein kinase SRK2
MDSYEFVKDIGKGTFGRVCLMLNRETKQFEAVKFVHQKYNHYIQEEILNHNTLSGHPNIIGLNRVFIEEDYVCIAMEFAYDGDLFSFVDRGEWKCTESLARNYFIQLLCAVDHCHRNSICHRDIKLENILLKNGMIKLCDFGYSTMFPYVDVDKIVGTPAYLSPERILRKKHDPKKADIWNCGVVLYILLCGEYPFQDKEEPKSILAMVKNILTCKYRLPCYLSIECYDLIGKILTFDPEKRLSINEIFMHPWMLIPC